MTERRQSESLCELAPLYVLGSLSLVEKAEFSDHLQECAQCKSEVELLAGDIADLALSDPLAPSLSLRSAFVESLVGTAAPIPAPAVLLEEPGILALRVGDLDWQMAPMKGVWTKILSVDTTRKYATSMVRMDPGAKYPAHRHAAIEEVFVLEGDLNVQDVTLIAGDYCRAEAATQHSESSTVAGCTLLVVTSQLDEVVATSSHHSTT